MKHTSGWYTYPSEKYDFVSWDDEIPNWMESHNPFMFQTTNQIGISTYIYQKPINFRNINGYIPIYPNIIYFNYTMWGPQDS